MSSSQQKVTTTAEDLMRLLERHLELKRQLRCVFIEMHSMVPVPDGPSSNKSPSKQNQPVQLHDSRFSSWASLHVQSTPGVVQQRPTTMTKSTSSVQSLINSVGFQEELPAHAHGTTYQVGGDSSVRKQTSTRFVEVAVDQLLEESMQSLDETPQKRQSDNDVDDDEFNKESTISLSSIVKTIKNELDNVEKSLKKSSERLERTDSDWVQQEEAHDQPKQPQQQQQHRQERNEISSITIKPVEKKIASSDFDCVDTVVEGKRTHIFPPTIERTHVTMPLFITNKDDEHVQLAEINLASERLIQNMNLAISSIESKLNEAVDDFNQNNSVQDESMADQRECSSNQSAGAEKNGDSEMEIATSHSGQSTQTDESPLSSLEMSDVEVVKEEKEKASEQLTDTFDAKEADVLVEENDDEQSTVLIEKQELLEEGEKRFEVAEVGIDSTTTVIVCENQVETGHLSASLREEEVEGSNTAESIAVTTITAANEVAIDNMSCAALTEIEIKISENEIQNENDLSLSLNDSQQQQEVFEIFSPNNVNFKSLGVGSFFKNEKQETKPVVEEKADVFQPEENVKEEEDLGGENPSSFVDDEQKEKENDDDDELLNRKVDIINDDHSNIIVAGSDVIIHELVNESESEKESEGAVQVESQQNEQVENGVVEETVKAPFTSHNEPSVGVAVEQMHRLVALDNDAVNVYGKEDQNEVVGATVMTVDECSPLVEEEQNNSSSVLPPEFADSDKIFGHVVDETYLNVNDDDEVSAIHLQENDKVEPSLKVESQSAVEENQFMQEEVEEIRGIRHTDVISHEQTLNLEEDECCVNKQEDNNISLLKTEHVDNAENHSTMTLNCCQSTLIAPPSSTDAATTTTNKNVVMKSPANGTKTFSTIKDNNNNSTIIPIRNDENIEAIDQDNAENVSQRNNSSQIVSTKDDDSGSHRSLDSTNKIASSASSINSTTASTVASSSSNPASFESGFVNKDKDWKKKFKQSLCVMPVFEPANANRKLALFEQPISQPPKEDYNIARTTVQPLPAFGTAMNPSTQQEAVVTELAAALKGRLRSMKLAVNTDE